MAEEQQPESERKNLLQTRQLNAGAGQAYAMAFELILTPALFAFFGWLIDRAIGVSPVFIIILPVIAASYIFWKIFRDYNAQMEELEHNLPARRDPRKHA